MNKKVYDPNNLALRHKLRLERERFEREKIESERQALETIRIINRLHNIKFEKKSNYTNCRFPLPDNCNILQSAKQLKDVKMGTPYTYLDDSSIIFTRYEITNPLQIIPSLRCL